MAAWINPGISADGLAALRVQAGPERGWSAGNQARAVPLTARKTLTWSASAATECLVPRKDLAWYYRTYCGDRCYPRDPRVSPIFADDLSGLPPVLIIAAEFDTLRDEARAYGEWLSAAGVATRYVCADGIVHGFLQMRGLVPDAQRAIEEIARGLN